jgi:hypothetical protein
VNPYKLYADELGADDDAFTFICDQLGPGNAVFSAGETNTRNYLLEFPVPTPNVVYNYAVTASWNGELPENHPANTTEVVAISSVITDNIYYVDAGDNGGNLIIDFWIAGYGAQPSNIIIESSVLSANATFANGDINIGTPAATYSCYSIDIPADNVTGTTGNYVYIIAEYGASDYSNEFGVPNSASADALAAYFYLPLEVGDTSPCNPVTVTGTDTANMGPQNYVGVEINGTGFLGLGAATTADVTYQTPDGDVAATNVAIIDDTTLTCDVDLSGNTTDGSIDIEVESDCGSSGTGVGLVTFTSCPSVIYTQSFAPGDADQGNWANGTGWDCNYFTGSVNSKSAGCATYPSPPSGNWLGRTSGFTVPACWSGPIELKVTHSLVQEGAPWDELKITLTTTPAANYFGTQVQFYTGTGFGQFTQTFNLGSLGVDPGETFYLWFFHGGIDGLFNSYTGYTIQDITID